MRLAIACAALLLLAPTAAARERDLMRFSDETINFLKGWNDNSVRRIYGCDRCTSGDPFCSIGSAMAAKDDLNCSRLHMTADYYGFQDFDDKRSRENPAYTRFDKFWDNKFDYESGIPDKAVINDSVESIKTNISAYFIRESKWKEDPYWMHIFDPGPREDQVDMQVWLMPCSDGTNKVEYWCRWVDDKCYKLTKYDCPCTCQCNSCTIGDPPVSHTCTETFGSGQCMDDDGSGTCQCTTPVTPCQCGSCVGGHGKACTLDGTECKENAWEERDFSECENLPDDAAWCRNKDDPSCKPDSYCCWDCVPANRDDRDQPPSYCGWGGVYIEKDAYKSERMEYYKEGLQVKGKQNLVYENDSYALKRNMTGIDCNDDTFSKAMFDQLKEPPEGIDPTSGQWGTVQVTILRDDDLVRDRFWKHNHSLDEFLCTRPGYCSLEGYYETDPNEPQDCVDNETSPKDNPLDDRDEMDRPASRQHDPCRVCKQSDHCPEECFNYDLRYYRQFNLDSVWVNVFKIVPELNYPLTPDKKFPDVPYNCIDDREGKQGCTNLGVHDGDCDSGTLWDTGPAFCIPGLNCIAAPWWDMDEFCCPEYTYYRDGCCREELSGLCTLYEVDCPNLMQTGYLLGIGEMGCKNDADCASYIDVAPDMDSIIKTTQRCSKPELKAPGGESTGGACTGAGCAAAPPSTPLVSGRIGRQATNIGHCTTPVRNQDTTGTCWAHAMAGLVETKLFETTNCGTDIQISERAIACANGKDLNDGNPSNDGANFVTIIPLLNSAQDCQTTPLVSDSCVGSADITGPCPDLSGCTEKYRITRWDYVQNPPLATFIMSALITGSVAFAMNWDSASWDPRTGRYTGLTGGSGGGHYVTIVGYDADLDCFVIKNSWGSNVGDNGYFYLPSSKVPWVSPSALPFNYYISGVEKCP